jgi:hypothetical protein
LQELKEVYLVDNLHISIDRMIILKRVKELGSKTGN